MGKKTPPLNFDLQITTEKPQVFPDIFQVGETLTMTLKITSNKGVFNHRGIDFEYCTEFSPSNGKPIKYNPINLRLAEAGVIPNEINFDLPKCQIPANTQTYNGNSFSVKHWVRVSVKKLIGSVDFNRELVAYNLTEPSKRIEPLCVRVAVADSIKIDLIINRRRYELDDMIIGGAHFLLVNLKVKSFTVSLIAQEFSEVNGKTIRCKNKIANWEISDGAPVKGEVIPIRLFLGPLNLTPSCSNPEKGYSVTHFLHFSVVTMSGERYYKDLQMRISKWTASPYTFTHQNLEKKEEDE